MPPATSVLRSVMCDWRMIQITTVTGQPCPQGVQRMPRHSTDLPLQLVRCQEFFLNRAYERLLVPYTYACTYTHAKSEIMLTKSLTQMRIVEK